jgi:hypothetical protein
MGKVGSTSILFSLQALNLEMPIYQVHVLSEQGIDKFEKMYWGDAPRFFRESLLPETKHIFTSHFLRAQLNKSAASKRWKVVTLVRDPIARNVSEFFYSVDTTKFDPYLPDFYERYLTRSISTREIVERFIERFHENSEDCNIPLRWFDVELKPVLGIDVYSRDFPKAKGCQFYEGHFADVLLLKLERVDEIVNDAFKEFLSIKKFKLLTTNTANQKRYYSAYQDFLREVNLPIAYIDTIYNSKVVQHFYSAEEINAFRRKWHKH